MKWRNRKRVSEMLEKYGAIDNLMVMRLSDLLFGTCHPQAAQREIIETWYAHKGLREELHMAINEIVELKYPAPVCEGVQT